MKKSIITSLLLFCCVFALQAQEPCGKEKLDPAKIISGSYMGEVRIQKYGKDEIIKSKATVNVKKIGEGKISVSTSGAQSFELTVEVRNLYGIGGENNTDDSTKNASISLDLNAQPAKLYGGSGSACYKEGDVYWTFETNTVERKPEKLEKTDAEQTINLQKPVEFGGDLIKRENKDLYVLGKANSADFSTPSLVFEAAKSQCIEVVIFTKPFPGEWASLPFEKQTEKFWNEYNKPFIDEAINKNADIRFINDPRLEKNKYADPPKVKDMQYATTNDKAAISKVKSYIYYEFEYLTSLGYSLQENGLMTKE